MAQYVQGTALQSSAGGGATNATLNSVTAGNAIVIQVAGWEGSNFIVPVVTTNQGDTVVAVNGGLNTGDNMTGVWVFVIESANGGNTQITVTPDAGTGNYYHWTASEVSPDNDALEIDTGSDAFNSSATGDANVTGAAETAEDLSVTFVVMGETSPDDNRNITNPTAGVGTYNQIAVEQNGELVAFQSAYKLNTAANTETANWTHDNDSQAGWGAVLVTLNDVTVGGGGGSPQPTGDVDETLEGATAEAAAQISLSNSINAVLEGAILSATARQDLLGALSQQLEGVVSSISVNYIPDASDVPPDVTSTINVSVEFPATAESILEGVTASSDATVANVVGTIARALEGVVAQSGSVLSLSGTVDAVLDGARLTSVGATQTSALVSAILQGVSANVTGAVGDTIGDVDDVLNDVFLSSYGTIGYTGVASLDLEGAFLSASASSLSVISGSFSGSLQGVLSQILATSIAPISIAAESTLQGVNPGIEVVNTGPTVANLAETLRGVSLAAAANVIGLGGLTVNQTLSISLTVYNGAGYNTRTTVTV